MSERASRLIRPAVADDASDVTELLAELGYRDEVANVRERLAKIGARDDADVLVAVVGGTVAGLAAYQLICLLERPRPLCRLTALVVRSDARRDGAARELCLDSSHYRRNIFVISRPRSFRGTTGGPTR